MIKKLRTAIRDYGLFGTLLYGLDRLLVRLGTSGRVFAYDLLEQPISGTRLVPAGLGGSLVTRRIEAGDPALGAMPVPESVLAARFGQGSECFGAFGGKQGDLVAYLWLQRGPFEEDEVRCRFVPTPEGESAWDYDVFVFREHRRGLGFARVWDTATAFLLDHGIHRSFSRVSRFNPHSRRAHERMGASRGDSAFFLVVGSAQLMLATVSPFVHLSLGPDSRPTLRLRPGSTPG